MGKVLSKRNKDEEEEKEEEVGRPVSNIGDECTGRVQTLMTVLGKL